MTEILMARVELFYMTHSDEQYLCYIDGVLDCATELGLPEDELNELREFCLNLVL